MPNYRNKFFFSKFICLNYLQHPPLQFKDFPVGALETITLLSFFGVDFLLFADLIISLVIAINESETLVYYFAEVSKNFIPYIM